MAFYLWWHLVKQFISASTAIISAPLLYAFSCLFESAESWTCFHSETQGLLSKTRFSFPKVRVGIKLPNCKRDQSITASRKCLLYLTLFENPSLCFAPWVSTSVPWKTSQRALFSPSMSGQCCPHIFAKHLGDKYTVYLACVIIVAIGQPPICVFPLTSADIRSNSY